jgi:hypothetical protein
MAAQRGLDNQRASVKDRSFYTVRGGLVVLGNIRPDVEDIGFGKRRENIRVHCLDKRHSVFIAWISLRA